MPTNNHGLQGFTDVVRTAIERIVCCRNPKEPPHSRFYESTEDIPKSGGLSPFVIFDDKFSDHFLYEDANKNWTKKVDTDGTNNLKLSVPIHDQNLPAVDHKKDMEPNAAPGKLQDSAVDSLADESGYGRSLDGSRESSISSTIVVVGKELFRDSYKIQVQTKTKCWYVTRKKSEFITMANILQTKNNTNPIATQTDQLTVQNMHDFVKNLVMDESAMKIPEVSEFLKLKGETTLTRPRERFCTVPEVPEDATVIERQEDNIYNITCSNDTLEGISNGGASLEEVLPNSSTSDVTEQIYPSDFEFVSVIGKGSFGRVILARQRDTNHIYAIKVLSKQMIVKRKEVGHVLSERSVLAKVLRHPYLVQLHYAFTTPTKIFFVLNYVNGGELFYHLQRERCFSEARSKFYTAEICCALTYMHSKGIIYRDLKPENILLDKDGHIVLTDFGLCKEGMTSDTSSTRTFCGTPEYLAPEILLRKPYTRSVDWWTVGIVLYEMLYGLPPFYSRNTSAMYQDILTKPLRLRPTASLRARDLLRALLIKNPSKRLGSGPKDGFEVKSHNFFSDIKWNLVECRMLKPPFVPKVTSDSDMSNIDPLFTREALSTPGEGSPCMSASDDEVEDPFDKFFYSQD